MEAKRAQEIAERNQLPAILRKIEAAALRGNRRLIIYDTLSSDMENKLKELRYSIEFNDELNRYEISW